MPFKAKNKVIVPIDFSDSSVDAIREGLRFAASPECVHVLHVVFDLQPMVAPYGYGSYVEPEWFEKCQQDASDRLDELLAKHDCEGVKKSIVRAGTGHEITEYAKQENADLIVIPSHGYHGLNRVLLGSTTERVLRHADCPVYVLRRRDAE